MKLMIFIYVKAMVKLTRFSEQARGRSRWSVRATWCPRAPRRWPLVYNVINYLSMIYDTDLDNMQNFGTHPHCIWCLCSKTHCSKRRNAAN